MAGKRRMGGEDEEWQGRGRRKKGRE